ncbi:MAG TPA: hypothetical protein VGM12_10035 [Trebonia sp.]|jgi:hypothetical protein
MTADPAPAPRAGPAAARFHFRPWLRRGIAGDITVTDGPGLPARAALDVILNVTALDNGSVAADTPPPEQTVHLYGPGDVIGIDPRHVIRTEPRDQTVNFEPNYLAAVEFDYPDFPWLFTPAMPNGDRLRPFVALVALKDGEYTSPDIPPNPLPAIDVQAMSALQPLDDAWNWAHAQISGDGDVTATVASNPAAVISRLLCPRRLDPETAYTAFLVPAFEPGRQAGLGLDVSGLATADPSWTSQTAAPLRLPAYYRFSFRTSDAGDFESLVRKLKETVLPPDVGSAPMDVSAPGAGIPGAGAPLGLEGALCSVATAPTPWSGQDRDAFQAAVAPLVNLTAAAGSDDPDNPAPQDPHIVPPFYGKWQAAATAVTPGQPGWPGDLNLDPRNRAAAAMGTQVVQAQRTALMASAWQQVAGIEAANQRLRSAQLSRSAMTAIWAGHLSLAAPATVLSLTAPVQTRVLASPRTVYAAVTASRVPQRLLSPAGRRVLRPLGPLARRAAALSGATEAPAARTPLLTRVNAGDVRVAPPAPPPGAMTSIDQVSDAADAAALPGWLRALLDWLSAHLHGWLEWLAVLLGLSRVQAVQAASAALRAGQLTTAAVTQAPPATRFTVTVPPSGLGGDGTLRTGGEAGAPVSTPAPGDTAAAQLFRSAAGAVLGAVQAVPSDPPLAAALDVATLSATMLSRLEPAVTVPRKMSSVISVRGGGPWFAADPLEPIMAAPSFPQPMYLPLRDLNQNYLLPGAGLIPPDSLGAVVANHAFIEAYLAGLNHEMARQLLWNGYPTDQRGSYFRQFWDVAGYLPQPGDPADPAQLAELLKDIPPMNTWPLTRPLGQNENRADLPADNVILLVRGELLRRYPNTVIFAGKAKAGDGGDNGRVLDESDQRLPVFRGTLSPDITFFGFNLSVDDARGGTAAAPLGFFFVFAEHPTEPRFGLEPQSADAVTQWEDLAWTNFAGGDAGDGPAPRAGSAPTAGFGVGEGTLAESDVSSVFPQLAPGQISRYRVASTVFARVLGRFSVPGFLTAAAGPSGVALSGANPEDSALGWGVNAAQTAAILIRMPFQIMVHADSLLPRAGAPRSELASEPVSTAPSRAGLTSVSEEGS